MQTITTEEFQELNLRDDAPSVINVLDKEHFNDAHIPGSQNIPLSEENFAIKVEQAAGSREQPVVVYCANAACDASPKAADTLEQNGFETVYDYQGGMEAWKEAGNTVESS